MEWAVRELKILWVEKILASSTRPAPQVRAWAKCWRANPTMTPASVTTGKPPARSFVVRSQPSKCILSASEGRPSIESTN